MMHRAWSSIVELPYCFSRSSVKFQGHTALKIIEFDPNWAFPDCNSSLNSPMAMKCCTKLETAKERCPIVFQGHPSNFKVTRYKTSPILTQIGRFRTIGQSQLSNPSDLPCCFAVLCCGYTLTDFPISIRLTSLALWQSNDCPSASKATLMNMDKYLMWIHYERLHNHNKAKHNKPVCIFLGIYCMSADSGKVLRIIDGYRNSEENTSFFVVVYGCLSAIEATLRYMGI